MKVCPQCKDRFITEKSHQKFCSLECQEIWRRENQKLQWREKNKKICEYCGEEYKPYFVNSDKQKFCSAECRRNSERGERKTEPSIEMICKYCKKDFLARSQDTLFCTTDCRMEYHKSEWRKQAEEKRSKIVLTCPICNCSFTPKKTLRQIYCSKRCRETVGKKIYKMMQTCKDYIGSEKEDHSRKVLGYSAKDLLEHLQTFPQWEDLKVGKWHLDHKFPIIAFMSYGIKDPKVICSLDNLQPLTEEENCSKNGDYNQEEFEEYLKNKGLL